MIVQLIPCPEEFSVQGEDTRGMLEYVYPHAGSLSNIWIPTACFLNLDRT